MAVPLSVMLIILILVLACKKKSTEPTEEETNLEAKYTLIVDINEGIWHYPESGVWVYWEVDTVTYCCVLKEGYSNLIVTLNDSVVPDSGQIIINHQ